VDRYICDVHISVFFFPNDIVYFYQNRQLWFWKRKKGSISLRIFFFVDHIREYMWTKKIYAPTKRTYVPVYFLFPFFVFYKCGCEFCCKKQASCSSKSKGTFAMYIGVSTFSAGMDSPLGQHPVSTSPHIVRFFCVFNTKFGYKSKL
jgi:hypothetical protein